MKKNTKISDLNNQGLELRNEKNYLATKIFNIHKSEGVFFLCFSFFKAKNLFLFKNIKIKIWMCYHVF